MTQTKIRYSFVEQVKLAVVLVICCTTLIFTDWLWVWDQQIYDIQMRASTRPAPDDVVIVAIDETSLNDFGRWPWPRNIHALLINRLNAMGAKTIVLDIIFSERDITDIDADKALAKSIQEAGNVVLPVLVEQTRLGSQLKETLPLPILIEAGAKLGHVHVELDADGMARSTYLYEGLGSPHWPHISLAALQLNSNQEILSRPAVNKTYAPFSWHRAEQRLIPFLGPPGHFKRLSYGDIIKELVNKENIQGKTVFVGVTATGLGDALPTPVSGLTHPMPGIEINANIFTTLRDNSYNRIIAKSWQVIISVLIVLLPVVFFPRISPRAALLFSISLIISSVLLSLFLLYFWQLWFAPLAVILTLVLSYPLWSWRRLEFTMRYLDNQIKLLSDEPGLIPYQSEDTRLSSISFISDVLSCDGWAIYDQSGTKQSGTENFTQPPPNPAKANEWVKQDNFYWLKLIYNNETRYLGLKLPAELSTDFSKELTQGKDFSQYQLQFLDDFRQNLLVEQITPGKDTIEIIEHQILQVQSATTRLRAMRRFVSASLDQMADAVIISSPLGDIVLHNQQAEYLFGKNNLHQRSFLEILSQCKLGEQKHWKDQVGQVISQRKTIHFQAVHHSNKDLLIQLTPLITSVKHLNGLIANFSDITDIKDSERKRNEYINFLSHDLRSPLSSALALIELSIDSKKEFNSQNAERLKQYTERALGLTEDFVQIARADNIDQINFFEIDLLNILYNAVDQLWELATEKNIIINIKTDLEAAECFGDASLLERALINILGNAIKYSPQNTVITATLNKDNHNYACSIADQGYGIDEDEIPRLFTRFHRSKQSKQHNIPGIGLGLAFVKSVIEGHNGSLQVESQLNAGSTFTVLLPIKGIVD